MKTLAVLLQVMGLGLAVQAQEVVAEFPWTATSGTTVSLEGRTVLRVENTNALPFQARLLRIENPRTDGRAYAVRGQVRYEAVEGDGFLEMWSQFPAARPGDPPGRYFSRTLGLTGTMGKISGTSGWREFELPFDPSGATGAPTELEINLHLPGRGRVDVSPVTLVRFSGRSLPRGQGAVPGEWWSGSQAGFWGGVAGTVIGVMGGLAGTLGGRGRARRFVFGVWRSCLVIGALCLVVALVAVVCRQPFHVWAPPSLAGLILVTTAPARLRQLQQQYAALELRRMAAADSL